MMYVLGQEWLLLVVECLPGSRMNELILPLHHTGSL